MTVSLHSPIVVCGDLGNRGSVSRTLRGAPPVMPRGWRQAEFFRDFTAPGSVVVIRGLHSASCLFHHAARQLADALHCSALPSFAARHGEQRNEGQFPNETKLRARPGNLTARGGNVSG